MEDKIFLFSHFLKENLCFIVYIVTLLLEFVPYCPMYLFHLVQCIGDLYLQTLCCWILPRKKCMTSWQEKSLLVCLWSSLSAYPLIVFYVFHLLPHKFHHHLSNDVILVSSCFHFVLLHFASFSCSNETQQEKRTCLFCVVMVLVMQVITVLFKRTSGPVKALEGKITYIALTS